MLLMRLRPGFFEANDHADYEAINYELKKTVILVFIGFMCTSAFRAY